VFGLVTKLVGQVAKHTLRLFKCCLGLLDGGLSFRVGFPLGFLGLLKIVLLPVLTAPVRFSRKL
jgi:hypothetical protein